METQLLVNPRRAGWVQRTCGHDCQWAAEKQLPNSPVVLIHPTWKSGLQMSCFIVLIEKRQPQNLSNFSRLVSSLYILINLGFIQTGHIFSLKHPSGPRSRTRSPPDHVFCSTDWKQTQRVRHGGVQRGRQLRHRSGCTGSFFCPPILLLSVTTPSEQNNQRSVWEGTDPHHHGDSSNWLERDLCEPRKHCSQSGKQDDKSDPDGG